MATPRRENRASRFGKGRPLAVSTSHGARPKGRDRPWHPAAIVDDADEPPAAEFDHDIDAGRARVERILDEFLHDGGRPLDDLARRDAVDENRIEMTDRHGSLHQ